MKIKVCGITQLEQLKELDAIGIDFAGLIFYPSSSRYILNKLNSSQVSEATLNIKKVGVFVNAEEEHIMSMVSAFKLNTVQLHGDETPAFCSRISNHVQVIKAFHLNKNDKHNIDWLVKPYEEVCDHYLFDTSVAGKYGGSGEKFEWSNLLDNKINKTFFLSGGVTPSDAENIVGFQHPFFYGVDVNSKFEIMPGVKDMSLIKKFRERLHASSLNAEST